MTRPLIISGGELSGIAPEILAAAWQHCRQMDMRFAVITDGNVLNTRTAIPTKNIANLAEAEAIFADYLPILPCEMHEPVQAGVPNIANAEPVITAIKRGVELCHQGKARGLVTAPIDKNVLHLAGFSHQGHTDFLQALDADFHQSAPTAVMMLASPELRCVPVTVHLSLYDAIQQLTPDYIQRSIICVADALQKQWDIPKPRIAVSGLNPHAGEQGQMGDEEIRIIAPTLEAIQLARPDISLSVPLPADSLFTPFMRAKYDAFVCMTHDQALIPIKTLYFDQAVNITLGLSFVRTSPDHGTAYDLAGTSRASSSSMIAAITEAWQMTE